MNFPVALRFSQQEISNQESAQDKKYRNSRPAVANHIDEFLQKNIVDMQISKSAQETMLEKYHQKGKRPQSVKIRKENFRRCLHEL